MGLFSKIFGSSPESDVEKSLEDLYMQMFQSNLGMSYSQSKATVNNMLKEVKEESRKEGTLHIPSGDFMLKNEGNDPMFKDLFDKRRKEGVRDEDIRWWWNLHDYEKRMMGKVDQLHQFALFQKYMEVDKLTSNKSIKLVRKYHPFYGDFQDTTDVGGDDRYLPWELKNRVNIYVEKRSKSDKNNFKKDIDNSSSFNSLVRKEIQDGNL